MIQTCHVCIKEKDDEETPFWGFICWPCFNPDERMMIKERVLSGFSIIDKALIQRIEQWESDTEMGSPRAETGDSIDFLSGYDYRFLPGQDNKRSKRSNWRRS